MGFYILLYLKAQIKPEYLPLIEGRYLCDNMEHEVEDAMGNYRPNPAIPEEYYDLYVKWNTLGISHSSVYFYEYTNDGIFTLTLCRRLSLGETNLHEDYLTGVKTVIVPISTNILRCEIEHDGLGDAWYSYTENDLR